MSPRQIESEEYRQAQTEAWRESHGPVLVLAAALLVLALRLVSLMQIGA